MSHQNLVFNSLHSLDNAQASFMLSSSDTYNHYTGNFSSQYSSGSGASYSDGWGPSTSRSSGLNPSVQPRSASPSTSHHAQSPSYIDSSYPSYTQSSPSYTSEPRRTYTSIQGSHQSSGLSHRTRSDDNINYSMSPPPREFPNHQAPNSVPVSVDRSVAWNSPVTQNPHQRVGINTHESFDWSHLSPNSHFVSFDPSWNDSLPSESSSDPDVQYNYSLEVSSVASPQPRSAAAFTLRHISPISTSSSPPESRWTNMDSPAPAGKSCSHCHATSTPLWRREPNTLKPLCNACGLYLSQRNKHRPQELIDADAADDSDTSDGDGSGPECSHCHTHHTSVWRRSKTGAQLCNACGVYSRLRGKDRPLSLKRNKIKPRSKHTPPTTTTPQ